MTNTKQPQRKKIIWQLPIAIAIIVAITALVGGIEFARERARLEGNLLLTARAMEHSVEQELSSVLKFTQALSSTLESELQSRNFSSAQEKSAHALTSSHIAHHIALTDESGQQLFNTLAEFGQPLPITKNLDRIKAVYLSAKPHISNLVTGTISGKHEVLVDVPVMQSGKVIYVLTSVLNGDALGNILLDQHFPDEWVANIFDGQGRIVSRTRDHEKYVGKKVSDRLLAQLASGNSGVYENINLDGLTTIAAYVRSGEPGFGVTIGVPKTLLWRQTAESLPAIAIAISIAVFALLAAWHFANSLKMRRESETQFKQFIKHAPVALAMFDRDMKYLANSGRWLTEYGRGHTDLIGRSHYAVNPDIPAEWKRVHREALDGTTLQNDGEVWLQADGSQRWLRWAVLPWIDANGAIGGIIISAEDISASKEAESARYLYSEALRQSLQPLLLTDPQSHITYVNPAFTGLFGYQLEDLVGKPLEVLVPPDAGAKNKYLEIIQQVRSLGSWSGEIERLALDGTPIPVAANIGTVRDVNGGYLGFVASYLDLRALREKEAMLRKLAQAVEQSPESVIITNLAAEIEYVNEAFVERTGYSRDEVLGRKPSLLRSGDTPSEIYADLWTTLRSGASWRGELRNRRKDGSEYVEFSIIAPIRQSDGAISHYVAVQQDITESRRNAEELQQHRLHLEDLVAERTKELHRQTQSLRAIIDNIPHMVWLKDAEGNFSAVNEAYARAVGMTRDQLLGKTDFDVWPQNAAEYYWDEDLAVMRNGHQRTVEAPIPGQPDTLYETFRAPIIDADRTVIGSVGFSRDIKSQRGMELELAQRAEEAEAATKAKSAFLANMSHEIRTPMNAIIGMADLCLETALNDRQRNYLSKIKSASNALLHIINDILDFSKIEAGKLKMEDAPFVLETVFDQLSAITALRAENQGIELSYDIDDDSRLLKGDPLRLGQVLTNLVTNALKFSVGGNVVIKVETKIVDQGWADLHFSVRDEGIGMSQEQIANLFQAFTQADVSTTRRYGGTGLGLAISKHLVERMEGRIWVESCLGTGSTFHFTARFTDLGIDRRTGIAALGARLAKFAERPVMVVDDSPIARRILEHLIGQLGLKVRSADSAEAALALVLTDDSTEYLACLVDWRMPGVDGITTIHQLRETLSTRGLPAPPMILVTAYSHHEELEGVGKEIDSLLAKPVSARHVYVELARCLGIADQEAPNPDRRKLAASLQWSRFRNLDILLVEDVELNQEVICALLEGVGLTTRIASNGVEALDEVARKIPDLILMDCQMPVMDGFLATRKLRENPAWQHIPIIALTANAMLEDQEACLAAGMTAHVAKPIRMESLYERMAQCLPEMIASSGAGEDAGLHSPSIDSVIPQFPGVNAAVGLVQVGGRLPLLLRVLKQFRDSHGQRFEQQFSEAQISGDWPMARRLAHSLKGVAHTLGATDLGEAASALEVATASCDCAKRDELLPRVLEQLRIVTVGLSDIDRQLEALNAPKASTSSEPVNLTLLLTKLADLLRQQDTGANDLALEIGLLFSGSRERVAWEAVAQAIERFDFKTAGNKLDSLRQKFSEN